MKTILVTGANGFVGTHTLNELTKLDNVKVIAACRDRTKLNKTFDGEIREGDLRDEKYLNTLLDGVDVVCNCMAWTSLWSHGKQSDELHLKPNLKLIDKVINSNVSRFIHVSSTSAASPENSSDAMSKGIPRSYWPHLCNVIKIENVMRELANDNKQMINLRVGIFAGDHYALGILPILLPRLKTHMVPWVAGGKTSLPIIDGRDIGQALSLASIVENISSYESFNIVGPEVPTVKDVIEFIHKEFKYPKPHFNVPFPVAYAFAWLMEIIDPIVPWEPLVNRSIIHLLEEVNANNEKAERLLGYYPKHTWQDAIRSQLREMEVNQLKPMSMARPIT